MISRGLAWLAATIAVGSGICAAQDLPGKADDESFLQSLENAGPGEPFDTRRLAKLLYGVAATLDGGKSSVRLLRGAVDVREGAREAVERNLDARFEGYARSVERFRTDVSALLDRPESLALLARAVADGHESCWRLDGYTRYVETYGAGGEELMAVLSSTQACSRFRRAAMQPVVVDTLVRALEGVDDLQRENRDLREELDELERLLDDLRRIDAGG